MRELRKRGADSSAKSSEPVEKKRLKRQPSSKPSAVKSRGNAKKTNDEDSSKPGIAKKSTAPKKGSRAAYDWGSTYEKVIAHLESNKSCSHLIEDLVSFANTKLCPNYTRNKLMDLFIEKYGKNSIRVQIQGRSKKRFLCLGKPNCKCPTEET